MNEYSYIISSVITSGYEDFIILSAEMARVMLLCFCNFTYVYILLNLFFFSIMNNFLASHNILQFHVIIAGGLQTFISILFPVADFADGTWLHIHIFSVAYFTLSDPDPEWCRLLIGLCGHICFNFLSVIMCPAKIIKWFPILLLKSQYRVTILYIHIQRAWLFNKMTALKTCSSYSLLILLSVLLPHQQDFYYGLLLSSFTLLLGRQHVGLSYTGGLSTRLGLIKIVARV